MVLKETGSTTHLPRHVRNNYRLLIGIVLIIGAFAGILCGSVGIFFGFLIIGALGKLCIPHSYKIHRQ